MSAKWVLALFGGVLATSSSGCAQVSSQEPTDRAAPRAPVYREHASTEPERPGVAAPGEQAPSLPEDLLNRMARDLAQRLDVRPSQLQVLSVESVVWNDGSLGCPQPGQSYLMAQVPGLRVLFQHAGQTYQYHASERGHFLYCTNPAEPAGKYDRQ